MTTEPTYAIDTGGYLVEVVNYHTCGAGDYGQHEPGCGMVPVAPIEDLLADSARVTQVRRILADVQECWILKTQEMRCTEFIGGTFGSGTFVEGMCCLPCRLLAAVGKPETIDLPVVEAPLWDPPPGARPL